MCLMLLFFFSFFVAPFWSHGSFSALLAATIFHSIRLFLSWSLLLVPFARFCRMFKQSLAYCWPITQIENIRIAVILKTFSKKSFIPRSIPIEKKNISMGVPSIRRDFHFYWKLIAVLHSYFIAGKFVHEHTLDGCGRVSVAFFLC